MLNFLSLVSSPSQYDYDQPNTGGELIFVDEIKLSDEISISTITNKYILKGIKNKIKIVFNIKVGKKKESEIREPFNLALVLDRSGSMEGMPFENCIMSIIETIDMLRHGDILHLVAYDNDAEVIFKNGTHEIKEDLKKKVNSLSTRQSTNLYDGIKLAGDLLVAGEISNKRMFLFSDGLVNSGLTDPIKICSGVEEMHKKNKINISSYGIGNNYDEVLMRSISDKSGGNYFFIDGVNDIKPKINMGLNLLRNLVGKNGILRIRGVKNAVITKIFKRDDSELLDGIKVGDLIEDDCCSFLIEAELTDCNTIDYEFRYENIKLKQNEMIKGRIMIESTSDEKLVNVEIPEITVAYEMAMSYYRDLKINEYMKYRNLSSAIKLKETDIEALKNVESMDSSGIIKRMIENAKRSLKILNEGNIERISKDSYTSGSFGYSSKKSNYK